jgi:predicted nucleotidyltransferase component of viral defense system
MLCYLYKNCNIRRTYSRFQEDLDFHFKLINLHDEDCLLVNTVMEVIGDSDYLVAVDAHLDLSC